MSTFCTPCNAHEHALHPVASPTQASPHARTLTSGSTITPHLSRIFISCPSVRVKIGMNQLAAPEGTHTVEACLGRAYVMSWFHYHPSARPFTIPPICRGDGTDRCGALARAHCRYECELASDGRAIVCPCEPASITSGTLPLLACLAWSLFKPVAPATNPLTLAKGARCQAAYPCEERVRWHYG